MGRATDTQVTPQDPGRSAAQRSRLWPKLLISLALGALFSWLAERGGVPIFPKSSSFRSVDWSWVAVAALR
ncbi:MAG: hypothetical protein JWN04_479, partial [Myxococcaceae bacterium]|nr:hypothetical protein [Myxococcaceae bacterium]